MFYSQFILAKKGPLGTIWIAAHLERKLRKNQVADTDIGVSVDSILFPEVPIALRLSSHLLLGVVRIYSRKVNYLFDDCSEALLKVKQAFRSTAVDLPPEESTAPYHSITLPETFDLDDFELPDNEIYQGNYVDHHISSREQITLQDNMEGVVFTTSQFGLDERFGDGDTSQIGLDLDEEIFLDKITVKGHDGIADADPQAPSPSTVFEDDDENTKEIPETFETMQVPSTPRRVNECNLFSIQASDDPLELENHGLIELGAVGIKRNEFRKSEIHGDAGNALDSSSHDDLDFKTTSGMHPEENGHLSSDPEIKDGMLEQFSLSTDETLEKMKGDGFKDALDGPSTGEDINNGVVINNELGKISVDQVDAESDPTRPALDGANMSPSRSGVTPDLEDASHKSSLNNTFALASEGILIGDQASLEPIDSSGEVLSPGKVAMDMTFQEESPGRPEVIDAESKEVQEPKEELPNSSIGEKIISLEKPVLQACNSHLIERDRSSPQGESCQATVSETHDLERSEKLDAELSGDGQTDCRDSSKQLDCAVYNDISADNSIRSPTCDFPAPEKLLSVAEGIDEIPDNLPLESLLEKENLIEDEEGVSGANLISGKKRSFTESTLTAQSLNSAESVGVHRSKRITESIPDDDDLLSSILVGRLSSVLKLKPSPTVHESRSLKRPRSAVRVGASKRKVLMDDMMVLHGDTIRQQLTSTEDIRRVRKKAPCTRPEISFIQRQFLEDEIFSESLYAGISKELSLLHTEAFDLSEIRVDDKDPVSASIEAANDFESVVGPNGTEESATEKNTETVIGRNDVETQPAHVSDESEEVKELTVGCPDLDVLEQQASLTKNDELEPLGEREMEMGAGNAADAENGFIIQELEFPSLIIEDKYDDPNVSLQMDISCFSPGKILDSQPEIEHPFTMNTEILGLDTVNADDSTEIRNDVYTQILDSQPEAGDPFTMNTESIGLDTVNASDSVDIRNDVYTDKSEHDVSLITSSLENGECSYVTPENGECSYVAPENGDKPEESILNVKIGGIDEDTVHMTDFGYDDKGPASVCLLDDAKMDSQYPSGFSMDFKCASYEGVNPDDPEADLLNIVDTEITNFDHPTAEDRCDFEDATVANDTEFLNVDDSEDDEGDDNMQFAADASFLENSGWSSRTRAVARYLQNLFDKETLHGRKVLHLDNLLINKTRKEASRMFFETLVLKTKDYLHVEQEKPFDNISLKPRVNLMKSNF